MNEKYIIIVLLLLIMPVNAISIKPSYITSNLTAGNNYSFNFTLSNRLNYSYGNNVFYVSLSLVPSAEQFSKYVNFTPSLVALPKKGQDKKFTLNLSIPSNFTASNYLLVFTGKPLDYNPPVNYIDDSSAVIFVRPQASAILNITINAPPVVNNTPNNTQPPPSSGGGGGSGGGGSSGAVTGFSKSSKPFYSTTITAKAEEIRVISIPESAKLPIDKIIISFAGDVKSLFTIKEVESIKQINKYNTYDGVIESGKIKTTDKLSFASEPTMYKYVEINSTIENEKMKSVRIIFKVDKNYLTINDIDPKTAKLNRFDEGIWMQLPTEKSSEDDLYLYYSSISDHLSLFAITSQKNTRESRSVFTEIQNTFPINKTIDYVNKTINIPGKIVNTTKIAEELKKPESMPLWLIGGLVVLILIVVSFVLPRLRGNYVAHG